MTKPRLITTEEQIALIDAVMATGDYVLLKSLKSASTQTANLTFASIKGGEDVERDCGFAAATYAERKYLP